MFVQFITVRNPNKAFMAKIEIGTQKSTARPPAEPHLTAI
jgi:hypothetical protein